MDKSFIPKIKTNIVGLDKLLFGGLNLAQDHNVVIIRSEDVNQGTVLGIQMLYGLSQSIHRDSNKVLSYFISNYDDEKYLNDLLLDTTIASCIQRMIKNMVRYYGFSFFLFGCRFLLRCSQASQTMRLCINTITC